MTALERISKEFKCRVQPEFKLEYRRAVHLFFFFFFSFFSLLLKCKEKISSAVHPMDLCLHRILEIHVVLFLFCKLRGYRFVRELTTWGRLFNVMSGSIIASLINNFTFQQKEELLCLRVASHHRGCNVAEKTSHYSQCCSHSSSSHGTLKDGGHFLYLGQADKTALNGSGLESNQYTSLGPEWIKASDLALHIQILVWWAA